MVKKKRPEALKSPKSSPLQVGFAQHDINGQVAHVQEPTNGANYDLLTGSSLEDGQSTIAGIAYDQPTSAMNGAAHEREDFAPLRAAALVQRKDPVDDEPCSRAKMWDPVKDCNDPHTFQVDLPDYTPAGQNRHEQVMDSMMMDGHPYYDDHLYGQARDNLQRSTNSGTRGGASMGLFNYSQPQPMASGFQGNVSMRPQPFQAVHPYGQSQRRRQQRPGYGNISILPPHPEESSRQNEKQSLDLISRGAALIDTQTRQTGHLYSQPQGSALQFTSTESRMAASTAYPLPAHHTESFDNSGFYSSPSIGPNLPRRIEPNPHQRSPLQDQLPFQTAIVSKAISMARYAETMEQQSNYTEAMRAYKETCTLFQEAIIRSGEHQERTECNNARNTYQARLDMLSRATAATQRNTSLDQDDQPEDDSPGRGKPQYSLQEDWALCHKEKEDLSWQEVAEMPMFKGKRKHRSLSQRKHTIGKMVAKNQEAENPWTEEENRKLCNLGDAGKTLGDIHRKFRSRNAESCLNQYFHLKGYHTTGISRTHTSHQARQEPSQYPQSTQNTHYSSVIGRHRGYRLHSAASVVDPIPHRRIIGTVLEQSYQYPSRSNQNTPSVLPLRRELPSVARRDADMAGQDAVKDRQEATMARRNSAEAHTYPTPLNSAASTSSHQNLRAAASTPSHPVAEGPEYPTSAMSAQVMPPNALGALNGNAFDNPPSSEVVDNESTGSPFTSRHQRRALSSSPSASTVNSPTDSTPATSAATSPTTPSHPPGTHYSPESQKAAANRVGKSRRPAHLEGF